MGNPDVTDIYITGYPRSGNTWLGRLLADVLGCAYAYRENDPLPDFTGDKTDAPYLVHKTHWLDTPALDKTVFIYRDPRDVAVSVAHYLQHNLHEAIDDMTAPVELWGVGSYLDFMKAWWYSHRAALDVRYCDLQIAPLTTINLIIERVAGFAPKNEVVKRAIERQTLEKNKQKYGASNHLRKGRMGEWHEHFTHETARVFQQRFGQLLVDQGFEPDDLWAEKFV